MRCIYLKHCEHGLSEVAKVWCVHGTEDVGSYDRIDSIDHAHDADGTGY